MNIAFIGGMGVGKTTTAQLLVDYREYTRMSFADAVKDDVVELLNYAIEKKGDFLDPTLTTPITRATIEKYKNAVFRPFLQWYGTDFWRTFIGAEHFWLQRLEQKITTSGDRPIVIDDCRFPNEAVFLRTLGFHVIKLERTFESNIVEFKNHSSETEINKIIPDAVFPLNDLNNQQILHLLDLYTSGKIGKG